MTRSHLQAMVQSCQSAGAKVLLLGMQVPPNYGPDYSARFADTFAQVAQQHKAGLVPFFLKGIADVPDAQRWFQADRIHPNAEAHPKMLSNVWPELKKLL
jgi:acyl-CoA thioesterase-1